MSVVQWATRTHRGLKRYTAVVDGTKYVLFQNNDGTYNVNRFDNDGGPGKLVGKSYMYGLAEAKKVALGSTPKRNPAAQRVVWQKGLGHPAYWYTNTNGQYLRVQFTARGDYAVSADGTWLATLHTLDAAKRRAVAGAKRNANPGAPLRGSARGSWKRNPMDKPTYDAGLKRAKQIGIDNAETALDQRKAYPSVRAAYAAFIVNAIDTVNEQRLPGREVAVQAFLDHVAKPKRNK